MQPGEEADGGIIGAELSGHGMGEGGIEDDRVCGRDDLEPGAGLAGAQGEEIGKVAPDPARNGDEMQFETLEGAVDGDQARIAEPGHGRLAKGCGEAFGHCPGKASGCGFEGAEMAGDGGAFGWAEHPGREEIVERGRRVGADEVQPGKPLPCGGLHRFVMRIAGGQDEAAGAMERGHHGTLLAPQKPGQVAGEAGEIGPNRRLQGEINRRFRAGRADRGGPSRRAQE